MLQSDAINSFTDKCSFNVYQIYDLFSSNCSGGNWCLNRLKIEICNLVHTFQQPLCINQLTPSQVNSQPSNGIWKVQWKFDDFLNLKSNLLLTSFWRHILTTDNRLTVCPISLYKLYVSFPCAFLVCWIVVWSQINIIRLFH